MKSLNRVDADIIVIGGGIVGLATAHAILQHNREVSLILCEKESEVGQHQSGHNSGVVHSGLYYKPGSLKAVNCRKGRAQLIEFCERYDVDIDMCGKVVVAVDDANTRGSEVGSEVERLNVLHERAQANGVNARMISKEELRELEPHCVGDAALHVPDAGIVDYKGVCRTLRTRIQEMGGEIVTGTEIVKVDTIPNGLLLRFKEGGFTCKNLINCAGLYSDELAAMCGVHSPIRIIPFRGEYYELRNSAEHKCSNLIYPVPDPRYPFLGVHFTRMIHGGVECGPNAVFAFAKEGYEKSDVNVSELMSSLAWPGTRALFRKHWQTGVSEIRRSMSKQLFCDSLRKLVPSVELEDLVPGNSGVRAQAVLRDGSMAHDFVIESTHNTIHVLNAPSPAATSSLSIGEHIAQLYAQQSERL